MMPFTKEKAKRAEFVIRELTDLTKVISNKVKCLEYSDRGDYEVVFVEYNAESIIEIDVTGTSLSELVIAILERIECDE